MTYDPQSRRFFIGGALVLLPLGASAQTANDFLCALGNEGWARPGGGASLSQRDIGLGLKDALKVATRKVVGQVGRSDGYFGDAAIRIPLPGPPGAHRRADAQLRPGRAAG